MSFPEPNDQRLPDHGDYSDAGGGGGAQAGGGPAAAQREQVLRQVLSPEARMRLNNIRMVKPDLASLVEQYLVGLAAQGRIPGMLTDDQLKQMLMSMQQPKRDFKINHA